MTEITLQPTDHDVSTEGGRLFARFWRPAVAHEDAPVILLFHDSLGCVELWRDFPSQLATATGLPVLAYDRLGFGRSDANPAALKIDFMEDEARTSLPALRAALGFDRFIPFGHSVGGAMAVCCAAAQPDSSVAIITESAQAFVEDRTLAGIREAQANFADPAQVARLARYHGDKAAWVLSAWIDTWLAPDFADWLLDAQLARLKAPVLALHGDKDEFGSPAHPQRIVDRSGAGGHQVLLPDCGHVPHREQPAEVIRLIQAFLSERCLRS